MSPRGFYTKEYIHPHFTSKAYLESDQHKVEIDNVIHTIEVWKKIIGYPRFLAMKVWVFLVWYFGPSRNQK